MSLAAPLFATYRCEGKARCLRIFGTSKNKGFGYGYPVGYRQLVQDLSLRNVELVSHAELPGMVRRARHRCRVWHSLYERFRLERSRLRHQAKDLIPLLPPVIGLLASLPRPAKQGFKTVKLTLTGLISYIRR